MPTSSYSNSALTCPPCLKHADDLVKIKSILLSKDVWIFSYMRHLTQLTSTAVATPAAKSRTQRQFTMLEDTLIFTVRNWIWCVAKKIQRQTLALFTGGFRRKTVGVD